MCQYPLTLINLNWSCINHRDPTASLLLGIEKQQEKLIENEKCNRKRIFDNIVTTDN